MRSELIVRMDLLRGKHWVVEEFKRIRVESLYTLRIIWGYVAWMLRRGLARRRSNRVTTNGGVNFGMSETQ